MKVAIVGTSELNERDINSVKSICGEILKKYNPIETTVISGGAKGVDTVAQEIGLLNGFAVKPIFPMGIGWEYYKIRNKEIAKECDELYCITTPTKNERCYHHKPKQDHQKTAGCYTLNQAKMLKKPTELIITRK